MLVCKQDITLLQYIRRCTQNMPVYFVKMSDEQQWESCDSSDRASQCVARDSRSSPPTLLKQLVELEFFSDVGGGVASDGFPSRPPSEVEQVLGGTLVSPDTYDQPATDADANTNIIMATDEFADTRNAADADLFPISCHVNSSCEIVQLRHRSSGDSNVSNCGYIPSTSHANATGESGLPSLTVDEILDGDGAAPTIDKDVSDAAAVSRDVDRSRSVSTSALSAELFASDNDTETCLLAADSELVDGLTDGFCSGLASFTNAVLHARMLSTVALVNSIHRRCLETMISLAFDMAWDVICTPTRIKFARTKEGELYRSLMRVALKQQDEIQSIIQEAISSEEESILQCAASFQFTAPESLDESGEVQSPSADSIRLYTTQIQDLVIARLNAAISCKLLRLVNVLHDSYTGVLTRCLASLEQKDVDGSKSTETSDALTEILNAAYHVGISPNTGTSYIKTLIEKMKQLMHGVLMRTPSSLDVAWKRRVASSVLSSLTDARCQRLAKNICAQIKDSVRRSHAIFETSLTRLEAHHNGRLQQTERQRLCVRKEYAPRIARLALESRSLRDLIVYGKPVLGPEIGRGQYGVVYSCDSWAGYGPCAVKSVAPPDDRHWNDLAMEFHYTTYVVTPVAVAHSFQWYFSCLSVSSVCFLLLQITTRLH